MSQSLGVALREHLDLDLFILTHSLLKLPARWTEQRSLQRSVSLQRVIFYNDKRQKTKCKEIHKMTFTLAECFSVWYRSETWWSPEGKRHKDRGSLSPRVFLQLSVFPDFFLPFNFQADMISK